MSLESFVVSDEDGKLVFPPTVPNNRTNFSNWIIGSLISLCFIFTANLNQDIVLACEATSFAIFVQCLVELSYRVILTFEELFYHFRPKYGKNIKELLKHTFSFTFESTVVIVISAIISLYFYLDHGITKIINFHNFASILVLPLLLKKILRIEYGPVYSSLKFEENDGLSYSFCMANSFFYGYLRLIIPKSCSEDTNLIERIEIYSDTNHVYVFPKLFILVPKSGICPDTLKGPNIEESSSLLKKKITIAGVQKRVYKNSVYKIRNPKRPSQKIYVCAEYATPVKTFWKAMNASGVHSETYKNLRDDIIRHFYLITRNLIREDPEIFNQCELIYYDDRNEKENFRDISQLLLGSIKSCERK